MLEFQLSVCPPGAGLSGAMEAGNNSTKQGQRPGGEDCVCVAVHIRPLIASELAEGCQTCLQSASGRPEVGLPICRLTPVCGVQVCCKLQCPSEGLEQRAWHVRFVQQVP